MGGSVTNEAARIVRGASRFGLMGFYFAKLTGTVPPKLPVLTLATALLSRTIGVGAAVPIREIVKDVWVVFRLFIDYVDDTEESCDLWYWDLFLSLIWPGRNLISYARQTPVGPPAHLWPHAPRLGKQATDITGLRLGRRR